MTLVCIRDDDVNAFTPVEMLHEAYRPMFEAGLPLNVAVVPAIQSDVAIDAAEDPYFRQEGVRQTPIVPPAMRGKPGRHSMTANKAMIQFVKEHPNIEVAQHGYSHAYAGHDPEFCSSDRAQLAEHLLAGRRIMRDCFGKEPSIFVPPWDRVSLEAMRLVQEHFRGISLKNGDRGCFPRVNRLLMKMRRRTAPFMWWRGLLVVEHPGYVVTRFHVAEYMAEKVNRLISQEAVVVLVVHHWEFFFDWAKADDRFLKAWHGILRALIERRDVQFLTFSDLVNRLES